MRWRGVGALRMAGGMLLDDRVKHNMNKWRTDMTAAEYETTTSLSGLFIQRKRFILSASATMISLTQETGGGLSPNHLRALRD